MKNQLVIDEQAIIPRLLSYHQVLILTHCQINSDLPPTSLDKSLLSNHLIVNFELRISRPVSQ